MGKFIRNRSLNLCLAALAAICLFNNACSTPAVPNTDPDPPDTAWYEYMNCQATLPRSASPALCDNVGRSVSYYNYTGTNANGSAIVGGTGPYSGYSVGHSKLTIENMRPQLQNSYHEYLRTLDAKTLAEMTAEWKAIAAQNAVR